MRHELIDRYIYDVTKNYSRSQRNKIKSEIAQDIDLKIDELGGDESVDERQIKDILKEFGTTQDIAKKYAKNGDKSLMPQPLYGTYTSFLWFGMFVATILVLAFSAFDLLVVKDMSSLNLSVIPVIKNIVVKLILSIFGVYSVVTIAFSILSKNKSGTKRAGKYIESLKGIPMNGKRINSFGVYFKYTIVLIITLLFTITPELLTVEYYANSSMTNALPIFELDYLKGNTIFLFAVFLFCVLKLVIRLIERRYNGKVLGYTVIANGLFIALGLKTFLLDRAIRPEYIDGLKSVLPNSGIVVWFADNINMVVAGAFTLILLIDLILTIVFYNDDSKCAKSIISTVPEGDTGLIPEVQVEEPVIVTEEAVITEEPIETTIEETIVEEEKISEDKSQDTIVVEKVSEEVTVEEVILDETLEESVVEEEKVSEVTEDTVRVARVEDEEVTEEESKN